MARVLTGVGKDKDNDDELLTEAQFCALTQISKETAKHWRWAKRGPDYVKMHRAVRYRRGDVRRWLAEQTRRAAS
jgi:predicted DNA-binding transcriptional regulator AlpA